MSNSILRQDSLVNETTYQSLLQVLTDAAKRGERLIFKTVAERMKVSDITASKYIEIGVARKEVEVHRFASAKEVTIASGWSKKDGDKT